MSDTKINQATRKCGYFSFVRPLYRHSRPKTGFLPIFRRRFRDSMSKKNFQRIHRFEYVPNMSQMIKIIILYGLCSHPEAFGSLWSVFKKFHKTPPKNENSHMLKISKDSILFISASRIINIFIN